MDADAGYFRDELLVVGWGKSPRSVTIFEMNSEGLESYSFSGVAAIGSGRAVATTTLLLLGHGRHVPFEYALYAVAAAKFAAESCEGVGKQTTMFVVRKRQEGDDPENFRART